MRKLTGELSVNNMGLSSMMVNYDITGNIFGENLQQMKINEGRHGRKASERCGPRWP